MTPELDRFMPELTPPPGGLDRLHRRMQRRRRLRGYALTLAPAGAVIAMALTLTMQPWQHPSGTAAIEPGLEAELTRIISESRRPEVRVEGHQAREWDTGNPDVRLFVLIPEESTS